MNITIAAPLWIIAAYVSVLAHVDPIAFGLCAFLGIGCAVLAALAAIVEGMDR